MIRDIHAILREYWGYDSFRPLQEDIIRSILEGRDTLAVLPTGGGKSICFQVPAMAQEGLCLVVSPLIALMKDQVENLRRKGITAYALYAGMTRKEVINVLKVATESNCKFLYVSPERLETKLFKEYLPALDIRLLAVDEAHCISQWGYDFRPPYLRIATLREELRDVPVLALTASATPEVQEDICVRLNFTNHRIFRHSFERPNLSYSVFQVDAKINKIVEILQKVPGSSIVYCKSRKRTKWISDLLNMYGIQADHYHAGLPQEARSAKQSAWIKGQLRTIVCTNAFGMGIDKPDVRVVIHADVPDCLENYYQEAGRAGRDGKKSYAVLLHDGIEQDELKELPDTRFPSLSAIRLVYQSIMNYLQVPSSYGEGNYYDFDLIDFTQKFEFELLVAIHAIRAMEQEGWLSFNEQVFMPSRVEFVTGKDWLYQFEEEHPKLEPLIKTLLRTYEGIFDQPTAVHEKTLARLLRSDTETVTAQLKTLQAFGIIAYTPQKDNPQLYFLQNRVRVEELRINSVEYEKRKQVLITRISHLLEYINDKDGCRSQTLARYFGDTAAGECGVCDNCLNKRPQSLSTAEFDSIHQQIIGIISTQAVTTSALLAQLGHIRKEKVWKVLNFLQAEEAVQVNEQGEIRKR
ncbi:MAG: RecQ family ATP-dependent DNA helicase [Candidatus Pseudobacter hemicellulosilyticus]|uniref:ATP-dependent DNA helicase RecQ n=1 Tax=Candidatus Pseudobacter hemicellulosilyticus TaxID=3121375 RepID=A0AAJ5WXQ2_9BACT|nr:MAG: RecQ family ATP-dependent DNA helicase [Pseudobacter sp.]